MSFYVEQSGVSPLKQAKYVPFNLLPSNHTIKKPHPFTEYYSANTNKILHVNNYQSPTRQNASIDELEFYRSECLQFEAQITYLKKELDIQFLKNTKVNQLEQRVELMLDQIQTLQLENEKLSRLNHCQIQNYELEIHSLTVQIQTLISEQDRLERDSRIEESLHNSVIERQDKIIKDQEMVKLYDLVDDQNNQIRELKLRLDKSRQDSEYEAYKNSKEVDQLKKQVLVVEKIQQDELQKQVKELELYHNTQITEIKAQSNSDELEILKTQIGIKNDENKALLEQNLKQKTQFKNREDQLNIEIENLKDYIIEQANHGVMQKEEVVSNIQIQTNEIAELFFKKEQNYQKKIETLEQDLAQKERNNQTQNAEIQELQEMFEEHNSGNKQITDMMRIDAFEADKKIKQKDLTILQQQKEKQDFQILSKHIEQQLEDDIKEQKQITIHKSQEFSQIRSQLEEQVSYLKIELENSRTKYYDQEKAKNKEIELLQIHNSQLEIQLRERVRDLEIQIEFLMNELRRVKELLERKIQECEMHYTAKTTIEREMSKMRDQNEELIQKISDFEEWRARSELSLEFQVDSLKQMHALQIVQYQREIRDLSD